MSVVTSSLLPEKPRRRQEESNRQRSIHQYLRWSLPDNAIHFAIPNGLMRSQKTRARAQGEGVLAGICDLCVCWAGRAIFLEVKAERGHLSAAQRSVHKKLAHCGCPVAVCRSPEDVEAVLRRLRVPLRATVSGWRGERLA